MIVTSSPIQRFRDALNNKGLSSKEPEDGKGYHAAFCPAHDDKKKPSLSYREMEDGGVYIHCFKGCSRESILASLNLREQNMHSSNGYKPSIRHNQPPITVIELGIDKDIHYKALHNFGVTDGYKYVSEDGKRYEGLLIKYKFRDGSDNLKIRVRYGVSGHDSLYVKETPGKVIPYGLWKLDEAIEEGYLLFCEGESDPWTLWSHGVPSLGIPGANMTGCLDAIDVAKELENIPRVYILQEPDQAQQAANLEKAAQGFYANVYKRLRAGGYTGEIYHVDFFKSTGYKDPNEMHKALRKDKTSELFKPMIEEALTKAERHENEPDTTETKQDENAQLDALRAAIDIKETPLEERLDALWEHIGVLATLDTKGEESWIRAIKNAFGKEVNLNKIRQEIARLRKENAASERKDMDTIAELFSEQFGDVWAYDIYGQTWRKYTGTHWSEPATEEEGKAELDRIFVDLLHALDFEVRSNSMLDCIHRLARGRCKRKFPTIPNAVNFLNGTWHIDTEKLSNHRKEDNFLYCLDYPFDETGDYPITRRFYESVLCVESKTGWIPDYHEFQAVMAQNGLALIKDLKMHRILFMLGVPRAGKSTIMRHSNGVCGNVQIHASTVEGKYGAFAGDMLFSSELEGKRVRFQRNKQNLVCADEIKPETIRDNEGVFKNMSAHSGVDMRGILKDEQIDNTWRPKMMISSNEKPRYKDTSGAIAKRIIYLVAPRERTEQEQDLNMLEKLMAERGAFARDCIRVAVAAIERGYIPKSHWMKEQAREAEITGNALKAFIDENCVLGKEFQIHTDKLYQSFLRYREKDGHSGQYAKLTMIAALKEMNKGIGACENPVRLDKEQGRALYGIRLKTELEESSEEEEKSYGLQDDPLLLPELAQAQALRCYDGVTMISAYRTGANPASQAALQESRYDVTNNSQKKLPIGTYLCRQDTKVGTLEEYYSDKSSYHRTTPLVDAPVERPEARYDPLKTIVPDCNIVPVKRKERF